MFSFVFFVGLFFFTLFLIFSSLALLRSDARLVGFRQGNGVYYVFQIFFFFHIPLFLYGWLMIRIGE